MAGKGIFGKLLMLGAVVGAGVFLAKKVGLMGGSEEPIEYAPDSGAGFGDDAGAAGDGGSADDGEQHASQE